jgi:hypothetical protein
MTESVKLRTEEEERLRALLRRVDALNFAHAAVLGEEWGYAETKAEMLATLEEMRVEAQARFESCRRELGIPDTLA